MKTLNWMITIILIFCLISVYSNTNFTENTEVSSISSSGNPETSQAVVFSVSDSEGPVIGLPTLNNSNPTSDEGVNVTFPINDIDGFQNATLFWNYKSANNTIYSETINVTTTDYAIDRRNYPLPESGYITGLGDKTPFPEDWQYGEYIYNESIVSEIEIHIEPGSQSELVYVLIRAKNITTGSWETKLENGSFGRTTPLPDDPVVYQSSNITLGYYVFAVTYRDGSPNPPQFDRIRISREVCTFEIPAPRNATFVEYNVTAFDNFNHSASSPTYSFLMDYTPTVTITGIPQALRANEDYIVNAFVVDPDSTVNRSSCVAYYQFNDWTNWTAVSLTWRYVSPTDPDPTHFFNGTIPASNLENVETNMTVRVNVSDLVGGTKGLEGTSGEYSIPVDSLAPRVISITIDGGTPIENVTLPTSSVYIEATFEDARGISSASIYYSFPNETSLTRIEMINMSFIDPEESFSSYNVTLPAVNETAIVEYFFEAEDFFGNKGNTSLNSYYSDGAGPVLDVLTTYPTIVNNFTDVLVLFNASDISEPMQLVVWFSVDNQTSWTAIGADPINYQSDTETFRATDLHYIQDNAVSFFSLEVIRGIPVDEATLRFDITHEMPTDLRIWLNLDDGRKFLLFDREPGPNSFTRNIDLISLGLTENDFNKGNFTLEIQDFSDSFSGSITRYEIEIVDYNLPLGYQSYVEIPATQNDTIVYFYINMTDSLWNSELSSIFSYYSDGLAPEINVTQHVSPLNLSGAQTTRIQADISDFGGVTSADTYYKFSESDDWTVGSMILNSTTGVYFFDVPIPTENGTLYYKVRAFDFSGLSSETTIYNVSYSHGLAPFIEVQGYPYPSPLDMNGTNTIRIWANVTDFDGTVLNCTIGYRFEDTDDWKFDEMILDEETGFYYFDVKVNRRSGNLTFIIYATDNLDLASESDPYRVEFENAGTTPGLPPELLPIATALALGGGSIAAVVYLSKKGKLKLPDRFRKGDTGTD